MSFFDLALIIIIGGFALFGLWFGLIHTLGSLIGTVLGVYLASRYYGALAEWLIRTTGWGKNFTTVIVFVISFFVINRLVGLAFWLVDRALSIFTRLPFLNGINKILGVAFGFLEGVLVLGIILYIVNKFPLSVGFMESMAASKIAPFCVHTAAILWPLIPDAIKTIQTATHGIL